MKLTTEQKNILIAEKMGWGFNPDNPREFKRPYDQHWRWADYPEHHIPSYFTDLNAVHAAEVYTLKGTYLQNRYQAEIAEIAYSDEERATNQVVFNQLTATAAQRAEAIGVVLNLWKAESDGKPAPFYGACGWE